MCGICGKLNFDPAEPVSPDLIKVMADTIAHRGPDDEGYYLSGPIGLGFRRLSIIDLNRGHQPLANEDNSVWIVFNGEIYNYQDLRTSLQTKGHIFSTETDTEVIVHLYEELGENCLQELRGMFAFAIWDNRKKTSVSGERPCRYQTALLLFDRTISRVWLRDKSHPGGPKRENRGRA